MLVIPKLSMVLVHDRYGVADDFPERARGEVRIRADGAIDLIVVIAVGKPANSSKNSSTHVARHEEHVAPLARRVERTRAGELAGPWGRGESRVVTVKQFRVK
jgi:hypothetical protein